MTQKIKYFNGFVTSNGVEDEITFTLENKQATVSTYKTICYSSEKLTHLVIKNSIENDQLFTIIDSKFDKYTTQSLNKQFTEIILKS